MDVAKTQVVLKNFPRQSLRRDTGSVSEIIQNREEWQWYFDVKCKGKALPVTV
jgi:hypothetical protein